MKKALMFIIGFLFIPVSYVLVGQIPPEMAHFLLKGLIGFLILLGCTGFGFMFMAMTEMMIGD
jgi:hypothetical protein